ncbi:MAG: hypothetical protein HC892_09440 [Saprospiraceae bacterium]|nr:hypothetical protein [Saprospiraceae bacterium]
MSNFKFLFFTAIKPAMIKLIGSAYFLFLLTPFLLGQSLSQTAKVSWGAELREPSNSTLTKVIAKTSDGLYALRLKQSTTLEGFKAYVERFDEKMNLERSEELELKYNGKVRKFEDVIRLGGQFYLLTSFHNQVQKKNYLLSK